MKWIVIYAALLHVCWGVLLLIDVHAAGTTTIHGLPGSPIVVALMLLVVGTIAIVGHRLPEQWRTIVWMPQQIVLLLSAATAIGCVLASKFADGVERPWAFILADQLPAMIAATQHTVAILEGGVDRRGVANISQIRRERG